jgi:hypothetical protein
MGGRHVERILDKEMYINICKKKRKKEKEF